MNGETTVPDNGRENEKSPVTNAMISDALKGLSEVKTAKINIEKVFVLNEKCFVKGIKPTSGNVIQLQNTKGIPPKKDESTSDKKCNDNINQQLIEIKNNDVKSALQMSGTNSKKIIITGSKAINDMETLQKIINQLANSKNNTDQIKIDGTTKKIIIQNYEMKTALGDGKSTIHIEPAKQIVQDQAKNAKNLISDKANTVGKTRTLEKAKDTTSEENRPPEVNNFDIDSSPEPKKKVPKQKRFLYRLKSKNGRVLTYTSDEPIRLKKPQINVTKMTRADVERLSKQYAAETRKKIEEANKRVRETINSKKRAAVRPTTSTRNITHLEDDRSPSLGVQTRKRQLKFLPDGRVIKDKKSRRESFSSTSLSSSDDEKEPPSTSDEDYNEFTDIDNINKKTTTSKKISPEKKIETNTNEINKSVPATKSNKSEIPVPKYVPAPLSVQESNTVVSVQDQKATVSVQDKKSAAEPSKRPIIDPAQLLSSLLGKQITSSQLNVIRFKPKNLKERVKNNTVIAKKVFIQPNSQPVPSQLSKNSSVQITTKFVASEPPPLSPICSPGSLSKRTVTSLPIRSVPSPSKNDSLQNKSKQASVEFARNNSLAAKTKPAPLQPIRNNSLENSPKLSPSLDWPQDLANTFKDFTDSRVVKTKAGPKKLLVDKLNESENPKTIYDIMNDIFDLMPSWNLHVLPENKSFCLAQVTRSRMGVPVLKKCVEVNSDFVAKVYVHQLHCKRYDGVYDTESKLKKLIKDVDTLVV